MRLHSRPSLVTHAPDNSPPRRRGPKFTHVLYIVFIISLLGYSCYYAYYYLATFEARGQIVSNTTLLSANITGRLENVRVNEGDDVQTDSVIAKILPPDTCNSNKRTLDTVKQELAVKKTRISALETQIKRARNDLHDVAVRQSLELNQNGAGMDERDLRDKIADLRMEREALQTETNLLRAQLQAYKSGRRRNPKCTPAFVRAPFDTEIMTLHRKPHETVVPGDPIATIRAAKPSPRVVAYLPPAELENLHAGQNVTVEFPNGRRDKGVVARIGSSGEEVSSTLRDGYRRQPTDVMFQVRPKKSTRVVRWSRFHLMEVAVRGHR